MKQRKVTYRLYPNASQKQKLLETLRVHQQLYNRALEQRIERYKSEQISIFFYDQCKSLTAWRAENPDLANINAQSSQVTLKRLDLAFKAFFKRLKNGKKPGFPRFKSFDRFSGWGYKTHGDGWRLFAGPNLKHGQVYLSGIGKISIRGKARISGIPKTAEILHKSGLWTLSVTINCDEVMCRQAGDQAIGLDWGTETFLTIVDHKQGIEKIENPRLGRKTAQRLKSQHQALSKTKKTSKHRKKCIKKLARTYRQLHCQRQNFLHQQSAAIIKKAGLIASETLDIDNLTKKGGAYKRGLNREILDTAPSTFFNLLKYKAEEAGIHWVDIPTRRVKPSQTCHQCGVQRKKSLSDRQHCCPCGAQCSRDVNAARVMLNWALLSSPSGQELSELWRSGRLAPEKQETHSIIFSSTE